MAKLSVYELREDSDEPIKINKKDGRQFLFWNDGTSEEIFPGDKDWDDSLGW